MKSQNIVYEGKTYWVLKIVDGYEVYRKGITHSVRVSQIGFTGPEGLDKAIKDCKNRESSGWKNYTSLKKN